MTAHATLAARFLHSHPRDAADVLSKAPPVASAALLADVPADDAAAVLSRMSPEAAPRCAASMPAAELARIVAWVPPHVGAILLRSADPALLDAVLGLLSSARRLRVEAQLRYPPSSVGESMDTQFPAVPVHWSLGDLRQALAKSDWINQPYIYVVDEHTGLVGVIGLRGLDPADDAWVRDRMIAPVDSLYAFAPIESVVDHPAWRLHDRLPVTSAGNALVGTLRHRDLRRLSGRESPDSTESSPIAEVLMTVSELCWGGLWNAVDGVALQGPVDAGTAAGRSGHVGKIQK